MILAFQCPMCRTELEVESDAVGDEAACPACNELIMVPAAGIGPGTILGNFEIVRKIGSGGMGQVYLARQRAMDRAVALKVLPPAMSKNPALVERFMNEVRTAGRLEHPNIVAAFDAGEDSGHHYMAMSLVEGEDLDDIVHRGGPLPEMEALRLCRKVAEALAYAWDTHRLLHRDIKPSNIMVERATGEAKLMDMGIAKCLNDTRANMTIAGMMIGTPFYMSPEQATSSTNLDCRADIYSLGATLYFLLTGTRPFEGDSVMGIVSKVLKDPIPPPQVRNPALTDAACDLLGVMMAKDADDRPVDWHALVRDIDMVLQRQPPLTIQLKLPSAARIEADRRAANSFGQTLTASEPSVVAPAGGSAKSGSLAALKSGPELYTPEGHRPAVSASSTLIESIPLNAELPPAVKRLVMIGTFLLVALLVLGVAWLFNKISHDADKSFLNEQLAKTQADLKARETDAAVGAKIDALQTRDRVSAQEAKRLENLEEMFNFAREFASTHPEDVEAAVAKYELVLTEAKGTKYALMADDALRDLEKRTGNAATTYLARLTAQVGRLARDQRYDEALALLKSPDARYAAETAAKRDAMSADLRLGAAHYAKLDPLLKPLVPNLTALEFGVVVERLTNARATAAYADCRVELDTTIAQVEQLKGLSVAIARGFDGTAGQALTLRMKSNQVLSFKLQRIVGDTLVGTVDGAARTVQVNELRADEQYYRLKDSRLPAAALMRAVVALNGAQPSFALRELSGEHHLLATELAAAANRRLLQGTWVATDFSGPEYRKQITAMSLTIRPDDTYTMTMTSDQGAIPRQGTFSLRREAIYFALPGRDTPEIWTLDWTTRGELTLSPRDGIVITLQPSSH